MAVKKTVKKNVKKAVSAKKKVVKKKSVAKAATAKTKKVVKKVSVKKEVKETKKTSKKVVVKKVATKKAVSKKTADKKIIAKKTPKKINKKDDFAPEIDKDDKDLGLEFAEATLEEMKEYQTNVAEARFTGYGIDQHKHVLDCVDLPWGYGKDRVVLLPIDPHFIYTYWEVTEDKMAQVRDRAGWNAKLNVRVYDVTALSHFTGNNAHRIWDIEVYERIGAWYLRLDRDNLDLVVEIGFKNDQGEFFQLNRSNYLKLPRNGIAEAGPIKWLLVDDNFELVLTHVEEYTENDLKLLRKILGDDFFKRWMSGNITGQTLSSMFLKVPANAEVIVLPEISSSNLRPVSSSDLAIKHWPKTDKKKNTTKLG